jgi:CubicO group peptidase (beta-lactamase class C family)
MVVKLVASMLSDALARLDLGLPGRRDAVDLTTVMAAAHVPGASIALIDGGIVAETMCRGVLRAGGQTAVTERTLFQAGSISKSVAAACALRLVADGVLDLDDDVNERLTSWRIPANGGWQPRVTLRQLLSHTAGLTVGGFMGYPYGTTVPAVPDLLDGHGNSLPVVVSGLPGLRFRYSGGGYVVMQQLLVDVAGTDFPTLADELVLRPAGMSDSTFAQPLPAALADTAATGHHPGPVPVPGRWHTYPEMAAAGLWSTATDLARFFLAIRASLIGTAGALLPQHLAAQMATPATSHEPYGLGLTLAAPGEAATIGHGGNDQGFENRAVLYPESGQGIVMMTNGLYGGELITEFVLPAVARAYQWPGRRTTPTSPAPTSPAPTSPVRYDGVDVVPAGDDLLLTPTGQQPLRFHPHRDGRWTSDSLAIDVWFDNTTLVIEQDGAQVRMEPTHG